MRRANTTFVNLRSTLDDVDPLVEASKPVAKRLQPFLSQARAFAADAEPTVRDLQHHDPRAGRRQRPDRPAALLPAARRHRHGRRKQRDYAPGGRAVDVGETRGAFQESADALEARRRRDRLRPPVHDRLPRLVRRLLDHRRRLRRARRDRARHDHRVAESSHPDSAGDEAVPALPGRRRGARDGRLERALRGGAGGARLRRERQGRCRGEARARR